MAAMGGLFRMGRFKNPVSQNHFNQGMPVILDPPEIYPQALPVGIIELERNIRFGEPFFTKKGKEANLFEDPDQTFP
jgi:hypothetical protein